MSKPINYQFPTKIKNIMLNELKKVLYKEKPTAKVINKGKIFYRYTCGTSLGEVDFHVPLSEMGDLLFADTEQAHLLIRWIVL